MSNAFMVLLGIPGGARQQLEGGRRGITPGLPARDRGIRRNGNLRTDCVNGRRRDRLQAERLMVTEHP